MNTKDNSLLSIYQITEFVLNRKLSLLVVVLIFSISSLVYAYTIPNTFKADVLVHPSESFESQSMGASGLSSLIGLNMNSSSSSTVRNLAILQSKSFLINFIKDNDLLITIFDDEWDASSKKWKDKKPTYLQAFNSFTTNFLYVRENKTNGLITISVITEDPKLSSYLANKIVNDVNQYIRIKELEEIKKNMTFLNNQLVLESNTISKTYISEILYTQTTKLMKASVTEDYAFAVIDPAVTPIKKHAPSKLQLLISGFFISLAICFLMLLLSAFLNEYKIYKQKGYK